MSIIWNICGSISLILGILGAFLPILPTTPFIILAAFCFSNGSERIHNWMIEHKVWGPPIKDWQDGKGLSRRVKIWAISLMWISILISAHYFVPIMGVKIFLICVAIWVSWFLANQPTKKN